MTLGGFFKRLYGLWGALMKNNFSYMYLKQYPYCPQKYAT